LVREEQRDVVFLVRMSLRDEDRLTEPHWRGSVHEINSGLRFYVTDARDVADFIGARLAEKAARLR
jgi:hypothetical protein